MLGAAGESNNVLASEVFQWTLTQVFALYMHWMPSEVLTKSYGRERESGRERKREIVRESERERKRERVSVSGGERKRERVSK